MILVLRAVASEAQAKLPVSSLVKYMIKVFTFFPILGVVHLSALYFLLPPLVLRVWILWGASLVIAAGRANSNFLFFLSRSDVVKI